MIACDNVNRVKFELLFSLQLKQKYRLVEFNKLYEGKTMYNHSWPFINDKSIFSSHIFYVDLFQDLNVEDFIITSDGL